MCIIEVGVAEKRTKIKRKRSDRWGGLSSLNRSATEAKGREATIGRLPLQGKVARSGVVVLLSSRVLRLEAPDYPRPTIAFLGF